eukprot:SAG11_NODE_20876_length_436_cov_1.537092_1_plen_73_part_01
MRKAEAWKPEDKAAIDASVEAGVGFTATNVAVTGKLREWLAASAVGKVAALRAADDGAWVRLAASVGTMLLSM